MILKIKLKINTDLNNAKCISGPNFDILALIPGELSHGQTQNGVIFDFKVKFDFDDQCRSTPKLIGFLTEVFYIFYLSLAVLAWTE